MANNKYIVLENIATYIDEDDTSYFVVTIRTTSNDTPITFELEFSDESKMKPIVDTLTNKKCIGRRIMFGGNDYCVIMKGSALYRKFFT